MADEFQQQPAAGGDPTCSSPGAGPDEVDPATAAITDTSSTAAGAPRPTRAGRVWVSLILATVLLILLIIFIAENSRSVTISFLGANGHISLALALLIAAVVGAAVTLLVGTARILQLRLEVRRNRRAATTRGQRLQPR